MQTYTKKKKNGVQNKSLTLQVTTQATEGNSS